LWKRRDSLRYLSSSCAAFNRRCQPRGKSRSSRLAALAALSTALSAALLAALSAALLLALLTALSAALLVALSAALWIWQRSVVEIRPFKPAQPLKEKELCCIYYRENIFRVPTFELFVFMVFSSKVCGEECDLKRGLVRLSRGY